jgi:hypothetical protein
LPALAPSGGKGFGWAGRPTNKKKNILMNIFYNLFVNRKKSIIEFIDLHLTKNLKAAKETLRGRVGVYSIICNVTGARYIGSSIDIGNRLVDHLVTNNTNEHLQNVIEKYGLENFTFVVVSYVNLKYYYRGNNIILIGCFL